MPTIPRYSGPQVQEQALRGGEQQAPDPRNRNGLQAVASGLDQVGDAADRIDLDIQSRAAFAAETQVKSSWLAADAQLKQKFRGADAAGYVDGVQQFWDKARQEQTQTLNPRAQAIAARSLGTAALQAQAGARDYFVRETERSQDESFNASQLAEIQRAAASGDPAVAMTSSKLLTDRNAQQAAIRGWTPEVLQQANMKATTMLHTNMIQDLQQKDPHAAQNYFTQNKGEIDGTRHAELEHSLTVATAANEGETAATKLWADMGPKGYNDPVMLDKMQDAVREMYPNEPEKRKAAMAALHERTAGFNATQNEANAASVNTVMDIYQNTKSLAAMKRSPAWTAMPATKQAQVEEHITNMQTAAISRANALDARSDAAEARAERTLARRNYGTYLDYGPDKLATMSEAEVKALQPVIGNELTGHLMNVKRSLVKSADKVVEAKIDQDDFNHYADQMGLKPFDKKSDEEKGRLGEVKYRVEQLIDRAQQTKGKALTRDEKNELVRGEMARTVSQPTWFGLSSKETPVISMSADDVKSVAVPDADKGQIVQALKAMYAKEPNNLLYAPTEANVRRAYLLRKSRAADLLKYDAPK